MRGLIFFIVFFSLLKADIENICDVFPSSVYGYKNVQFSDSKICGSSSVYSDSKNTLSGVKCYTDTGCSSNVTCNIKSLGKPDYDPEFLESNSSYSLDDDCNYPNECNFTHTNYASNTNNFNNNAPSTLIFEANESCSDDDPNKKCMTFRDITLQNKNFTLKFYPGDYYFNALTINSDTNITLPEGGKVRIFVKSDFKIKGDINKDGDSHNLFIYVEGNILVEKNSVVRAYIYSKGDFNVNDAVTLYGAVTAEGNANGNKGTFIYEGGVGDLFNCSATSPSEEEVLGFFDAWDVGRNINDRNISTKIVGKEFNLTIASINKDNNATEKKTGIDVKYALVSNEGNLSGWRDFNATNNETITTSYTINKADKNVSVMFKVCADYNGSAYKLKPYNNCHNECNPNNKVNEVCWRKFKSSDEFAIRPKCYHININTSPLYAGRAFDINVSTSSNNEYNGTASIEANITDTTKTCVNQDAEFNLSSIAFNNGESNNSAKFDDVGIVDINITDTNWAAVDNDDTPQQCDEDGNGTYICVCSSDLSKLRNIRIIPDHFEINATYNNYNNGLFTYVSSDLNMSALLDINITAKNEDNGTTHNYNKNCYSEDFNLSFSYEIKPSDFNVTKNIPKLKYILNSIADTREGNITTNNYYLNFPNLTKNIFNTDDNGSAHISVKINFDKNYSNSFEEFNMTVRDVNVSDVNGTFGSRDINDSARFIYGRIKVSNAAVYNKSDINTTFEYQYWTNGGWVVNQDHNDTNDGNVVITSPLYAPNPSDITMNTIKQSSKDILEGKEKIKISTTHSLPYSAKIHLKINSWLWYHPLAKNYQDPSSANTDCLTHPCMKLDFLKSSSGWGGVQSINNANFVVENRTSEINTSHTDVNVTKSQVKKINW